MGPIPNRDQNQLLITNTAVGSFGFELEEYCAEQLASFLKKHYRVIVLVRHLEQEMKGL